MDHDLLRKVFTYNPASGAIRYSKDRRNLQHFGEQVPKYIGKKMGSIDKHGHLRITLQRQKYAAHKLAWFLHYGVWPDFDIYHIDGDGLNNRIDNLTEKKPERKRKPETGVSHEKSRGRFRAYRIIDGELKHIGYFKSRLEAIAARKKVVNE